MNKAQIMIVEDERIVAYDLQNSLEKLGYYVIGIANSGVTAIEKAIKLRPDLILMDIMLEGEMNGIQAAFRIGRQNQNIPIVYLTAYADNSTFRNALDTNPFGYLKKPFTRMQLKTTIDFAICKLREIYRHSSNVIDLNLHNKVLVPVLHPKSSGPFEDILGKYGKTLLCLVRELGSEDLSQLSLNLLIKVCYELAVFNIRKKMSKISKINKRWNLSIEDIAIESISNLFIKNSKQDMLNLKCFAINWTDPITDNTEALYFLNKVAEIRIDQYLNKMFRETDPFFAKVLDTLYCAIKKQNYCKIDHFGSVYIVKKGAGAIQGNIICHDEFMNIPMEYNSSKNEILSYLMDYLETKTEYFPAIPLNPLVERLLEYHQHFQNNFSNESSGLFEQISADDIIYSSLRKTISKMKITYLNTQKLNQNEAGMLASALADVALDFREGNTIRQLSDYLRVYQKDFSMEMYRERYRNIFEYLVKIFRQSIAGKLKK